MEIVKYLFSKFLNDTLAETILLILLSLVSNILHTNVITHFNSAVITSVQERAMDKIIMFFKYFMYSRIFLALFNHAYKTVQDQIMSRLREWFRFNLIEVIFKANNENISNINFTKLQTPINRLATTCYLIILDTMNYTIPYMMFVIASIFFFIYQNLEIGIIFLIGNILWIALMFYVIPSIRKRSRNYEASNLDLEKHMQEVLNNIDKILTRGQMCEETNIFAKERDETAQSHLDFFNAISITKFVIELIALATMFICVGYAIHLFINKKINAIQFVSLFTLLMVFKERINSSANLMSDAVEQYGRLEAVIKPFEAFADRVNTLNKTYIDQELSFQHIVFKDVWFSYGEEYDYVLQNKSLEVETDNNKIIGIVGDSGKGKSTFTKLLLKLYTIEKGNIYIDDVDISKLNPDYLRKHITYINQNSRLFDNTVLKNVLYGCKDPDACRSHYKEILKYPKIRNLYKNVDLNNDSAGYSGEKLSGGQRQIVNIISGLINPSKILILDEPTNALDRDLKMELLQIIKYFKPEKQCIFIITHDKDVHKIFDEKIEM